MAASSIVLLTCVGLSVAQTKIETPLGVLELSRWAEQPMLQDPVALSFSQTVIFTSSATESGQDLFHVQMDSVLTKREIRDLVEFLTTY